jgi:Uma2 family endonuclease
MASTEALRSLAQEIAYRKASGLDRFDEWWDGEYVIVTGPTPEHGWLSADVIGMWSGEVKARGLRMAAELNIGVDKVDCRVPDIGVCWSDTPRTSPAFMTTAELVVEILSSGERPGAKLDFYAHWNVKEYVEIDPRCGSVRLLQREGEEWRPADQSDVLGFRVEPGAILLGDERLVISDNYAL